VCVRARVWVSQLAGLGLDVPQIHDASVSRVTPVSLPPGKMIRNLNKDWITSFERVPEPVVCKTVVEEPTLFVIRYEYANLFHTSTDWYAWLFVCPG